MMFVSCVDPQVQRYRAACELIAEGDITRVLIECGLQSSMDLKSVGDALTRYEEMTVKAHPFSAKTHSMVAS